MPAARARVVCGAHLGDSIASPIAPRNRDLVTADVNGDVHRGSTQPTHAGGRRRVGAAPERRERRRAARVARASGSGRINDWSDVASVASTHG